MLETSARLLRLLSLLQARRDWPGTELAVRLDVSPRTLRRDMDKLRSLGYPVDAVPGTAGGYRLGAGAALPHCCSMMRKPSRSRSACAQRPGALSPG
jgi:predicted DNA-binding transcriptional regulator YafY